MFLGINLLFHHFPPAVEDVPDPVPHADLPDAGSYPPLIPGQSDVFVFSDLKFYCKLHFHVHSEEALIIKIFITRIKEGKKACVILSPLTSAAISFVTQVEDPGLTP